MCLLPDNNNCTIATTTTDEAIPGLVATNAGPTQLGASTTFTAVISSGTNVTYTWDFDDGSTASGPIVSHVYTSLGTYTVTVTAVNSVSAVQTETIAVVIEPGYILYFPIVLD